MLQHDLEGEIRLGVTLTLSTLHETMYCLRDDGEKILREYFFQVLTSLFVNFVSKMPAGGQHQRSA